MSFCSVFRTLGAEDQNNIKFPGRKIKKGFFESIGAFPNYSKNVAVNS